MAEPNSLDRLKAALKTEQPDRFYVFYGPEAYLRAYYLDRLHKLLVEDYADAFNYHRFNAANITPQAVHDSIESIPMMGGRSMVQIDDVNFFAMGDDGAVYAQFFSALPEYCTLVLTYETVEFKIDKRKKALAAAFEQAVAVEFTEPSERELITWIGRHFKKQGKQITVDDARYLISRTGSSMTALLSEIGKLSAYVQPETVTRADIDLLVEPVLEAVIFDLTDAVAAGRTDRALLSLDVLLRKQEEPISVLASVGAQMRRILTAKRLLGGGKGQQELMKLCGLSSYPAQKAMEFARRLPEAACARAVELCLEADAQMKTSYDDPARILELLVIRLTGGRQ